MFATTPKIPGTGMLPHYLKKL